jgi:hypothetical protein
MSSLHTALNSSPTKLQYSFSKSRRFNQSPPTNDSMTYNAKSGFQNTRINGTGRPFFSTSTRFDYYASPNKQKKQPQPAPGQYQMRNTFGPESFKQNQAYIFGEGREKMKKIYIDEIMKHGETLSPGPGRYEQEKSFGKQGIEYSMASRLKIVEQSLEKSKKLPGPGQYVAANLTGKSLTNSQFVNTKSFSLGKEQRFMVPTKKEMEVSPTTYKPNDNLNEDFKSTFKKTAQTVFGKNNYSVIDQHFNLKSGQT